jgi:hypothetical protein
MKVSSLVEVISAAHLSHYVQSPFKERGGIMLVGPPGSFKTTIAEITDCYPNAGVASDLTIKQASRFREDMSGGKLTTIAFTDFSKLYQRHSSTAANIEGFLRGITAEGYRTTNWEDSRAQMIPARALVVGCMTQSFYMQHITQWKEDGFSRRFLWSFFRLANPDIIIDAIAKETKIEFTGNGFNARIPTTNFIKMDCSKEEVKQLLKFARFQDSKEIGLILLKKMLSALKWKFPKERRKPIKILEEFSQSLGKDGAVMTI